MMEIRYNDNKLRIYKYSIICIKFCIAETSSFHKLAVFNGETLKLQQYVFPGIAL